MGITGDGLMTAQAVGAVTVHQTTVPLTQHGGRGRAVSASQLVAGDTLCSLTPWCRYTQTLSPLPKNTPKLQSIDSLILCLVVLVEFVFLLFNQHLSIMQVNEETGNRRPVMLTVQRVPRMPKPAKAGSITDSEREEGDTSKAEETQTDLDSGAAVEMSVPKEDSSQLKETTSGPSSSLEPDNSQSADIVVQGLTEDMTTVLIRACVSMISVPVDPDTLHATLRLCLRLTRNHHYAMMFAELKSTRMILGLTQSSGFNGFTPLVTLLFRHIIEDPATLRHTMEKV